MSAVISRRTELLWRSVFFAAGLAICLAYGPDTRRVTADNQTFFFMAERVAAGVPPHISNVNHKNALPSIVCGAAIWVGRKLGVNDVVAARISSMLIGAATVAAVWAVGLELTATLLGAHLAGLAMLTHTDFLFQSTVGVRPNAFMAAFMVFALLAFLRSRRVAAGAYAMAAFLCWQPVAVALSALVVVTLFERDRWRGLLGLARGALFVLLLYEAYFLWHGAVVEQLRQAYLMASDTSGHKWDGFLETTRYVLTRGHGEWTPSTALPAVLLVVLVGSWIALAWPGGAGRRLLFASRARPTVLLGAHAALGFTYIDHQAYPDLFFVQPYTAVLVAFVVERALRAIERSRGFAARRLATAGAMTALVLFAYGNRHDLGTSNSLQLADQYEVAAELDMLVDDHGSVWAVSCLHLLALNRMENWVPFGVLIDRRVRDYARAQFHGEPYRPFRNGKMPAVILTSRGGERNTIPWLRHEYARLENRSFERESVQVWIRYPPGERPSRRHKPEATAKRSRER